MNSKEQMNQQEWIEYNIHNIKSGIKRLEKAKKAENTLLMKRITKQIQLYSEQLEADIILYEKETI